jgi:hypothetical protein
MEVEQLKRYLAKDLELDPAFLGDADIPAIWNRIEAMRWEQRKIRELLADQEGGRVSQRVFYAVGATHHEALLRLQGIDEED